MVLPLKSNLFGETYEKYYIFLTVYKTKIWILFPREFFYATIRSIRSERVKILKIQKYPLVNSLPYFPTVQKKK